MTNLTWETPFWTSPLHALESVVRHRSLTDPVFEVAMRRVAEPLQSWSPRDSFWFRVIPIAVGDVGACPMLAKQIVEAARAGEHDQESTKSTGPIQAADGPSTDRLASLLDAAAAEFRRQRPRFQDELPMRLRPIRQQWSARGPGFLRQLGRWCKTDSGAPSSVRVIGVTPILGGYGQAYRSDSMVMVEAVLTDADDRLPELARLAWLIVQLRLRLPLQSNCDLASARLDPSSNVQVPALLLTLAMAQQLDWFSSPEPPLQLALERWLGVTPLKANRWVAHLPADWHRTLVQCDDLSRLVELSGQ